MKVSTLQKSFSHNKLSVIAMYSNEPSFFHTTVNATSDEVVQKIINEYCLIPDCFETVISGVTKVEVTPNYLIVRMDDVICYRIYLRKVFGHARRLMHITTIEGRSYYVEVVDERIIAAIDKCTNQAAINEFFISPVNSLILKEGVGRRCQS